jgi:hypothetical protein
VKRILVTEVCVDKLLSQLLCIGSTAVRVSRETS